MTDCICRFQGRALDRPQTDASSDGLVPSGRGLARVPNTEAVKAASVKSAAGIIVDAALRSKTEQQRRFLRFYRSPVGNLHMCSPQCLFKDERSLWSG